MEGVGSLCVRVTFSWNSYRILFADFLLHHLTFYVFYWKTNFVKSYIINILTYVDEDY